MNPKKILALALSALLVLGTASVLTGCGEDPAQVIRESLTERFDSYKNADDEALSAIAALAENEGLDELGIDDQEFAVAVLDGFDYSIDDITIDGNNATATVTIVSKSYSDFEEKVKAIVSEMSSDSEIASKDEQEISTMLGERVMQAFDDVQINTEVVVLEYVLNGNEWQPVAEASTLAGLDSVIFHK